jgi:hypothetical protein
MVNLTFNSHELSAVYVVPVQPVDQSPIHRKIQRTVPVSPSIPVIAPMRDQRLVCQDRIERVDGRVVCIIEESTPIVDTFLTSRVPCHLGTKPLQRIVSPVKDRNAVASAYGYLCVAHPLHLERILDCTSVALALNADPSLFKSSSNSPKTVSPIKPSFV